MKNVKKTSSKSKPRGSVARKAKSTETTLAGAAAEAVHSEKVEGLDDQNTVVESDHGSQQAVSAKPVVENKMTSPQPVTAPSVEREVLKLALSQSLFTKLVKTAQDEGISLESFASELVAEGLVLRAWEIAERKNTMRNLNGGTQTHFGRPNNNGGNHNGNHRNDNRRPRHGNNSGGGRRQAQNNNWMEDKAAFLEYVRNQEKRRR